MKASMPRPWPSRRVLAPLDARPTRRLFVVTDDGRTCCDGLCADGMAICPAMRTPGTSAGRAPIAPIKSVEQEHPELWFAYLLAGVDTVIWSYVLAHVLPRFA